MMNQSIKWALGALILVTQTAFAIEPANGWYAGLMAGASYTPSTTYIIHRPSPAIVPFTGVLNLLPAKAKLNYNILMDGGGQVGFRCNHARFEGELLYNDSPYGQITLAGNRLRRNNSRTSSGFSFNGGTQFIAGLFNVYLDIFDEESDSNVVPYVGVGLGYASIKNQVNFIYNQITFDRLANKQTTSAPIGQVILGVNYFFNEQFSLGTDLRYMSTKTVQSLDTSLAVATWNLVFNYTFNEM